MATPAWSESCAGPQKAEYLAELRGRRRILKDGQPVAREPGEGASVIRGSSSGPAGVQDKPVTRPLWRVPLEHFPYGCPYPELAK